MTAKCAAVRQDINLLTRAQSTKAAISTTETHNKVINVNVYVKDTEQAVFIVNKCHSSGKKKSKHTQFLFAWIQCLSRILAGFSAKIVMLHAPGHGNMGELYMQHAHYWNGWLEWKGDRNRNEPRTSEVSCLLGMCARVITTNKSIANPCIWWNIFVDSMRDWTYWSKLSCVFSAMSF